MLLQSRNDQGVTLGWHGRLASAVRRRARHVLGTVNPAACEHPAEAALAWLAAQGTAEGMPLEPGGRADRATTARCRGTLAEFGQHRVVAKWPKTNDAPSIEEAGSAARDLEQASPIVGFARQTAHDYLAGNPVEADAAWARLVRMQKPSGAIPCGWHGAAFRAESILATKYFLDAALLQARLSFTAELNLPEEIAPDDGRLEAILSGISLVAERPARIADVGCGSGRILKHLIARFPHLDCTGIDPSAALLSELPAGVARRSGGLLSIPARDGEFDAAIAVESLEHSLVPGAAVAELCRIVRPGGRILIIDKHSAWKSLSEHEPWERWFEPHEVVEWLNRSCDRVAAWPVAHGEQRTASGLFWCWSGRRA